MSRLSDELVYRGVSRREFMQFCSGMAAILSLPTGAAAEIAKALDTKKKPTLVWLEFQDCAGNSESFLRAARPTAAEVVLDVLSLDFHEVLMAAAGHQAEANLEKVIHDKAGEYIVIIEGSIPTKDDGVYCIVGGHAAIETARKVTAKAAATIAIGTCAAYGGIPAASPNPTGAVSVSDAVPGIKNLINLPACPANAENLTALIVHYLTFGQWPALDNIGRPLFAYGKSIHDNCERRSHYDAGQYVEQWGDAAHRQGACLYKVGCKGPVTYQNCPVVRWNEGTNWPVGCGHPCVGCAEPDFFDRMTPFYRHLEGLPGFEVATDVDKVGTMLLGATAVTFVGHGLVKLAGREMARKQEEKAEKKAGGEK